MARILIIDDDLMLSQMLQEHLTGEGFDVMAAHMAEEGLALAIQIHPDLIMLDVQLPDATGFQTCGRLREDPRTHTIPIIMMTGTARFPNQQEIGKRMGANEYLLKPFDVMDVGDKVHALLGTTPTPRMETISAEDARQSKEDMRARLMEQATKGKTPASSATPSVLHGMKHIPARSEESTTLDVAASQLNFYKPVASMDLRKPAEEAPKPSFFDKATSIFKGWFTSRPPAPIIGEAPPVHAEEALIDGSPVQGDLATASPAKEVAPAPTSQSPDADGPSSLSEFLGGPERHLPVNTPVRIEIQQPIRPVVVSKPADPPAPEHAVVEPPVIPMQETGAAPAPLTQTSSLPLIEPTVPLEPAHAQREPEIKPAAVAETEEATPPSPLVSSPKESFLSTSTLAWSMMVSHVAVTCASGFFFSGKADAIEAFAVVLGGWTLLVGVLMSMAALLEISMDVKSAWKMVALASAPLVLRSMLSLVGDLLPLYSPLHALTTAQPFFGSSFWSRPWDLFELTALLIIGYHLGKRPGGSFLKCVIATVVLGLIGALTGRGYFRPF